MSPDLIQSWLHNLLLLLRENDLKALFLLLLVEEAGVPLPLPGDTVIALAGYRASMGQMDLLTAGLAVTAAVQIGSTALYFLSRRMGHGLLFRYGRFIHLDPLKLEKVERWIQRRGPAMVLVGRLTPGLRTPTSIMAGIFEVPFPQFLFYATISALVWSFFWLMLGFYFGQQLLPLSRYLHQPVFYIGIVVLAAAGAAVFRWWRARRRRLRADREANEGC